MKVYDAIFDEESTKGVYGISLVESPAIMEEWIMLTDHPKEIKFTAVDDVKNLLLGAVLIPEQRIYRNIDGNEFEMKFSAEVIEKLAHNFQKQSYQNNSSLEHETKLSDVTFVEQWIVENSENDKSNAFGKTYPKGTWVAMSKVSDEVYAKAKKGEIKGFSIDALLQLTEVNFKNDVNMNKDELKSFRDSLLGEIKTLFSKDSEKEEVKLMDEPEMDEPKEKELEEDMPSTEVEALKDAIMEMLAQFSVGVDKKIEAVKVDFSKVQESKDKQISDLKVELSKIPEGKAIKPKLEVANVQLTKQGELLELMRKNKN
jgi:hypothetical protein